MSKRATLRARIRALLASGELPVEAPNRIWGGKGAAAADRCVICLEPFAAGEIHWEAEFDFWPETSRHDFHISCYATFDSERKNLQRREKSSLRGPTGSPRRIRRLKAAGDDGEGT